MTWKMDQDIILGAQKSQMSNFCGTKNFFFEVKRKRLTFWSIPLPLFTSKLQMSLSVQMIIFPFFRSTLSSYGDVTYRYAHKSKQTQNRNKTKQKTGTDSLNKSVNRSTWFPPVSNADFLRSSSFDRGQKFHGFWGSDSDLNVVNAI